MKLLILCIAVLVALAAAAPSDVAPEKNEAVEVEAPAEAYDEAAEDAKEEAEEEAEMASARECFTNCNGRDDGHYAACDSCLNYVSCSGGVFFERPCPANLEWDNNLQICNWASSTCGEIRRVTRSCQRNSVEPNAEPLRIQCEAGRVIFVRQAWYGRRRPSRRFCPYSRDHDDDTNCLGNPNADRTIVRRFCDGQNSCEIVATNELFGNPCFNTYKYLQVRYSCVKA